MQTWRVFTLWELIEKYFKPYAAAIAQDLAYLAGIEESVRSDVALHTTVISSVCQLADALLIYSKDLCLPVSQQKALALLGICRSTDDAQEIRHRMRDLRETMVQELFAVQFFRVTDDMLTYLGKEIPFGQAVADSFPECSEDICEANGCFAFERYTASMFHLGRAMETVVQKFAVCIGATAPDRDEWQRWLNAINAVINAMPHSSPRDREARMPYCETAGYLLHFKDAWRNPTAHPKKTYTRGEALDVLNGAKAFMDSVARNFFQGSTKA